MHTNYRKIVYEALYEIIYNKQFCHIYINSLLNDKNIDTQDIKIIRRVVYGIIENKILIDYIINKYTKNKKIDKKISLVLSIGVYELLFLNNKKEYATINECVELAKHLKGHFLSKFVNAILNNINKNESIEQIYSDENITDKIKYSIPDSLYDYLMTNLNVAKDEHSKIENNKELVKNIFEYFINNNSICLRINTKNENIINNINKEFDELNIKYNIYDGDLILNNFKVYVVSNLVNLNNIKNFANGNITVEDVASVYYIDKLFDIFKKYLDLKINNTNENLFILDACSAPGGKTLALFEVLKYYMIDNNIDKDLIKFVCHDINSDKILKIDNNIKREITEDYHKNIFVSVKDATIIDNNYIDKFDLVMLDVPCSGLGSIAKKPDIKYNFDSKKIDELNHLQKKILDTNKKYVKKDGLLAYSTCTFNKKENDDIVYDFLDKNDNFELLQIEQIIPNINNKSDGFYYSIFKRIK